jgi:hypothetical protein
LGRGDLCGVGWSRGILAKECGGGSVSRGGRRGNRREEGVWIGFIAAHCFVEERERIGGHRIGLKTAGGFGGALGCVAAARLRRPDVARRGEDSGGGAAVGGRVGRRIDGRRTWPGSGGGVRQKRSTGGRERGRRKRTQTQFQRKVGTLL